MKYTQDYKLKEPAYLKVGFKKKSVRYKDGVKVIKYEKKCRKERIITAWGLATHNQIHAPLFHTKKEAKKHRFVEDIVKLEIKIIKREKFLK